MSEVKSDGVVELQAAVLRGEQVIDVRELHEFDSGHVTGAVHIPMSVIPVRMNEIEKNEEIWVICQSGNRSGQVTEYLTQHGYRATNVEGGTKAWIAKGFPVEM
jgi:rhodanese-related sulfurtransferase